MTDEAGNPEEGGSTLPAGKTVNLRVGIPDEFDESKVEVHYANITAAMSTVHDFYILFGQYSMPPSGIPKGEHVNASDEAQPITMMARPVCKVFLTPMAIQPLIRQLQECVVRFNLLLKAQYEADSKQYESNPEEVG